MKKRITKLLITGIMLVVSSSMVGCTPVNDIAVKFGFKNDDFNYMKTNKVDEIIIQNTRDSGFRFKVTDQTAIEDIYNALASGNPKSAKSSLDADYIFEIHCGDEIKNLKPDPEIFLKVAEKLNVLPENCIVLEDSRFGVYAAKNAGMYPIMVPDLLTPDEELLGIIYKKADDLGQVIELLK